MKIQRQFSAEELDAQPVEVILTSLDTQLNSLPPCGNKKMSHDKDVLRAVLRINREEIKTRYNGITFKDLKKKDPEKYSLISAEIDRAVYDYYCFA